MIYVLEIRVFLFYHKRCFQSIFRRHHSDRKIFSIHTHKRSKGFNLDTAIFYQMEIYVTTYCIISSSAHLHVKLDYFTISDHFIFHQQSTIIIPFAWEGKETNEFTGMSLTKKTWVPAPVY
ncbi:hypothetical protein HanRHA438_Chr07g0318281 [Helianthus annuus]|nr:hypothetical protein HanRHA438_Chr07g0318281 [Helianthus annuus]